MTTTQTQINFRGMNRRPTKTELLARMPRVFRPRLRPDQILDLGLCHIFNLDAIASGQAGPSMLWDWIGSVLTWVRAAELSGAGVLEMTAQLEVAVRLVERFGRTGLVRFDGPDYQLAKLGLQVMDELARTVDRATAIAAADWSEIEVEKMAAAADAFRAQEAQAA